MAYRPGSGIGRDAAYQRFLRLFAEGTGATPMFAALAASGACSTADSRRATRSQKTLDAFTLAVGAMAVVGAAEE